LAILIQGLKTESQLYSTIAFSLGREMDVETEIIRREYVTTLYERGHDNAAEEILPQLDGRSEIGVLMLSIGRLRFVLFMTTLQKNNPRVHMQAMSSIPAQSWQWLNSSRLPESLVLSVEERRKQLKIHQKNETDLALRQTCDLVVRAKNILQPLEAKELESATALHTVHFACSYARKLIELINLALDAVQRTK